MATTTITTTAQQDARIVAAFGAELNLGRNATQAEVKALMIERGLREIVLKQERLALANEAAALPLTPLDPA